MPLDLSHMFKANYRPIQSLVLNAGLQCLALQYSADGVEKIFAVNHLGRAILFHLLGPYLASNTRIVVKTDFPDAKSSTVKEPAHPTKENVKNNGRRRYATSKLVNILWAYALAHRFADYTQSKTVIAMDPALTPILRWVWVHVLPPMIPVLKMLLGTQNTRTQDDSGSNLAWLAVGSDIDGACGVYYEGRKEIKSSVDSYDEAKQKDLWSWTVKFVAKSGQETEKFGRKKKIPL
ncbi:hypothetical protein K469DRAFT_742951 [Zopfia rhizophila CBS 207.26]|uniref:NAD(P)-binding protein n=1 Tax=Zopfia rhizophila CBS 207.26 TaxID=1314779 RepID=A0A6A6DB56_9PEZI|nr:hypothetical protein K469DRAFT_742951 [Zopfia rhizophila CBS 207.26]